MSLMLNKHNMIHMNMYACIAKQNKMASILYYWFYTGKTSESKYDVDILQLVWFVSLGTCIPCAMSQVEWGHSDKSNEISWRNNYNLLNTDKHLLPDLWSRKSVGCLNFPNPIDNITTVSSLQTSTYILLFYFILFRWSLHLYHICYCDMI